MKKLSRKIFACLFAAIMLFSAAPFMEIGLTAKAEGENSWPKTIYSGDYTLFTMPDNTASIAYNGNEKDLIIPSVIDGYIINGIYNAGFLNCSRLESVTIPKSITRIGEYAFLDCRNLSTVSCQIPLKASDIVHFGVVAILKP